MWNLQETSKMKTLLGRNKYDWVAIGIVTIGAFIVFNLLGCREAHASDTKVIETIAFESRGEPFEGQVAVAEVIRTRSRERGQTFEQVVMAPWQFSCWNRNARLSTITGPEFQRASHAWQESESTNYSNGANLYANLSKCTPKWMFHQKVKKVKKLGRHTFFKENP